MDNSATFAALKAATLGAQDIQAPPSTLGASDYDAISKYNYIDYALPQSNFATNAGNNIAQQQVAEQKAAAARAAALAKQKEEDMADPRKYRKGATINGKFMENATKEDGGYDFFDPNGQQVDIATLTQRTGTKPSTWLEGSQNPIDLQYAAELNNLNDYVNAKLGGNSEKAQEYEEAEPLLAQYQGKGGMQKLMDKFNQRYERYFVPRSTNPNAWGTVPDDKPLIPSNYYVPEEDADRY